MADRLVVGDTVTLSNTFAVSGTATDPTTVSLVVTDPAGTATTYTYAGATITKSSTGVYTKNITASTAGIWSYAWTGTGTAADVASSSFAVEPLAPIAADTLDVLTLLEAKTSLGIAATDTQNDTALKQKITAVSRRLDRLCGPIVQRTVTDEVHPGGCPSIKVRRWPVASFTTVTEYDDGTAQVLTLEDFDTRPDDGKVWTADSGAASWVTPAGGGGAAPIAGPTFSTGRYAGWSGSIDTRTTNAGRGFYVPMPIPRSLTVDRIGVEVTASPTGSPVIRLGIYEDNNGVPGDLILDAGTVSAASPGFLEITISQALTAGMVWLCCVQQGGSSNGAVRATRYATHVGIPSAGYTPYESGAWSDADVQTGALLSTAPAMNDVAAAAPRILMRVV